jgi:hypothetical protein
MQPLRPRRGPIDQLGKLRRYEPRKSSPSTRRTGFDGLRGGTLDDTQRSWNSTGTAAPQRVIPNRVLLLAHRYREEQGLVASAYLREINVTKIFVFALAFGAVLAVLPAAAQTRYGVKKNAPSTSTFDRGWNHANQSKDRARAGAAYVRHHHASPFDL